MAASGNDWNSLMQTKRARMFLYGICVFFCVVYAVDGLIEMFTPERAAKMIEIMGQPGYYAMTIIRTIVLLATGVAFGRMVIKISNEEDK
ncbi:MAG: hypothetical protein IKG22_06110 [Atopobiaceae bacterium]|nr:hypothetical protein [Atopobiaceae bacterium]